MSQLIVALYEDFKTAEAAAKQLVRDKKLNAQDVSLLTYESDTSAAAEESRDTGDNTFLAQKLGSRRDLGAVHDTLVSLGVSDSDAGDFAEGLRRGNTLLAVQADDAASADIRQILASHQPINIIERAEQWRKAGWTGFRPDAEYYTAEQAAAERKRYAAPAATGEQVLPVMEEQLVVGKREVQQGGVRAYTRIVEKPVEETVNLRQEHVQVERRPVDRPVAPSELETFKEGTIEMTERTEEPVVTKQARVIEEVVLHKDVEERAETIRDTVRRTDVQVEDIGASSGQSTASSQPTAARADLLAEDSEFRNHYDRQFANSGFTYEQVAPAYRFGHNLHSSERYRSVDWNTVEPEARQMWEQRNPGTWEKFKN
ncbi:MAG TPA: YsnF/AvaK domain-containing protein, partial [Candidatus Competibacteraceae bacterium]|nr:YsnF/AvaK domain-containing protein [Candidatus Competibacteraceae bacterium]